MRRAVARSRAAAGREGAARAGVARQARAGGRGPARAGGQGPARAGGGRVLAALGVAAMLSGCGYAIARKGGPALQVAAVRNDTAEAEAGGQLASALRDLLHQRGRLAADSSGAPGIEAELVSLRNFPSALGGEGAAAFRLEAQVKLRARGAEDTATASEDYLAGVDVLGTEANRRAALRRVLRAASRELVDRLEVAERLR